MINVWRSLRFTIVFAVLLGLVYPLFVTGIGQALFPFRANGSIVQLGNQPIGSELVAQGITAPGLFHPRPSAVDYAGNGSGGSNLGPTNPALVTEVRKNLQTVERENPGTPVATIPTDMVESSGSGLDPDISIQDARIQVPRIARATGIKESTLFGWITALEHGPALGIWGDWHVNVMDLNLAIEKQLGR